MKVSDAYREANGFTPEKIADVMIGFYEKIDARSEEILRRTGGVVILVVHHRQHIVLAADISQHALL